jgi:methionyl-tRNA formyltransferase
LPQLVWNMPAMGTINVHASLLPQYRGAAPINWAVINGEAETGVTTFRLKHEIDTGDILLQERIYIGENESAGELHDRLKELGAGVLVKTVKGLADGTLNETPQRSVVTSPSPMEQSVDGATGLPLKHAPKIFTETCRIEWNKPIAEVHNLIRGLSPFPGAFTYLDDKLLKIYRSEKEAGVPAISAGTFETDGKNYLKFAGKDGFIVVKQLQIEGKKKMQIDDFLRGYKLLQP